MGSVCNGSVENDNTEDMPIIYKPPNQVLPFVRTKAYEDAVVFLQSWPECELKAFVNTQEEKSSTSLDSLLLCECVLDIYCKRRVVFVTSADSVDTMNKLFDTLPESSVMKRTWRRENQKHVIRGRRT